MIYYSHKLSLLLIVTLLILSCRSSDQREMRSGKDRIANLKDTGFGSSRSNFLWEQGAIFRGDTTLKEMSLVFTGDEFGDGAEYIAGTLKEQGINASFFLTGNYYRNELFKPVIKRLHEEGNYLGAHSDKHLLYCDWDKRDSLLVSKQEFLNDLHNNYTEMEKLGISPDEAPFFLPPYEWYNDSISLWTGEAGLRLVNFTPGTRSNADYTYPEMGERYIDSRTIYESVLKFEKNSSNGMNGFILLVHIGTHPGRQDKFYRYLPQLIKELKNRGYQFVRIDDLLN